MSGAPAAPSPDGRSGTTRLISEMYLGFLAFGLPYFCTDVLGPRVAMEQDPEEGFKRPDSLLLAACSAPLDLVFVLLQIHSRDNHESN